VRAGAPEFDTRFLPKEDRAHKGEETTVQEELIDVVKSVSRPGACRPLKGDREPPQRRAASVVLAHELTRSRLGGDSPARCSFAALNR
jgi:hypothetical protein